MFDAKNPRSKPMLTQHQLEAKEHISMKFWSLKKMHVKIHDDLLSDGYFIQVWIVVVKICFRVYILVNG